MEEQQKTGEALFDKLSQEKKQRRIPFSSLISRIKK